MHGLWNEDTFVARGDPAWHRLGHVFGRDRRIGAKDAFDIYPFIISLEDLFMRFIEMGTVIESQIAYRAIIRHETPKSPEKKCFGTVGPEYHLITPERICELVDAAIGMPIETYGVLNDGEEMFITFQLGEFAVRGDECTNYLLLHIPYNGINAYRISVSTVRTVCANTLRAAEAMASESFKISHDAKSEDRLTKWMSGIYDRSLARQGGLSKAFEAMATKRIPNGSEFDLIERAMPLPNRPRLVPDPEINAKRDAAWEIQAQAIKRKRAQVVECYQGKGWGMDTVAAQGTPWGLWNATAEAYQYAPHRKPEAHAYNNVFGGYGDAVERMFTVAYDYAVRN